ncbi:MAG: haloacid dehalogenase type II [Hyphomicrobiales bacterium]|nr:haloacid dehalogenase type II [Hyphomicrobiales bacterium]
MPPTFALDIYGTLIDPHAISTDLASHVGDVAMEIARDWRNKQLEYSFRRGLMGEYRPFAEVTRAALDYACAVHGVALAEADRVALMDRYRTLAAFADAAPALEALAQKGAGLHAFSNGDSDDIAALLSNAGLENAVESIVSAEAVPTFKPDPRLYAHFIATVGGSPSTTWLVSSNPFDVIGAAACGWRTVWVRRSETAVFDPWNHAPTVTVDDLRQLAKLPEIWGRIT